MREEKDNISYNTLQIYTVFSIYIVLMACVFHLFNLKSFLLKERAEFYTYLIVLATGLFLNLFFVMLLKFKKSENVQKITYTVKIFIDPLLLFLIFRFDPYSRLLLIIFFLLIFFASFKLQKFLLFLYTLLITLFFLLSQLFYAQQKGLNYFKSNLFSEFIAFLLLFFIVFYLSIRAKNYILSIFSVINVKKELSLKELGKTQKIIKRLYFLQNILKDISQILDYKEALDTINKKAYEFFDASSVIIAVLDKDEQALKIESSYGLYSEEMKKIKIKPGEGIIGAIFEKGEGEVIKDASQDKRGIYVEGTQDEPESLIVMPLIIKDKKIGIVAAYKDKVASFYNKDDLPLFKSFANAAASTIENSSLYTSLSSKHRAISLLKEILSVLSKPLSFDETVKEFLKIIYDEFSLNRINLLVLEKMENIKSFYIHPPIADENVTMPFEAVEKIKQGAGVVGKAIKEKKLIYVEDVSKFPTYIEVDERTKSEVVVPLIAQNEMMAVLNLEKPKVSSFSKEDIEYLEMLASELATFVKSRFYWEDIAQKETIFEALYKLALFVEPSKFLSDILVKSVDLAMKFSRSKASIIFLRNSETGKIDFYSALETQTLNKQIEEIKSIIEKNFKKEILATFNKELEKRGGSSVFPIFIEDKIEGGVVNLEKPDALPERIFVYPSRKFSRLFAQELSIILTNIVYRERIKELSITDELTGLFNYREFINNFSKELERAKRFSEIFSLIFIDVDDLKVYNDTYGHLEGNKVLEIVAKNIKESIRNVDTAYRWGGEEFVIILPKTTLKSTEMVAERIRKKVENASETCPGVLKRKITISVGVSSFQEEELPPDKILETADKLMYEAKKKGKNKVYVMKDLYRE